MPRPARLRPSLQSQCLLTAQLQLAGAAVRADSTVTGSFTTIAISRSSRSRLVRAPAESIVVTNSWPMRRPRRS